MSKDFIKAIKILVLVGISALMYSGIFVLFSIEFGSRIWWLSDEKEVLINQTYALELPDDYKFVKGEMDFGLDNRVDIMFKVNKEEFEGMLGEGWEQWNIDYNECTFMRRKIKIDNEYIYSPDFDVPMARLYLKDEGDWVICYLAMPFSREEWFVD